jgi:hypothetical protein
MAAAMSAATVVWKELKALRCWTPLRQVSQSAIPVRDVLYKICDGQYLLAVSHNERFERDEKGPFVTGLLWAETDGAAKRATLMEIEADDSRDASSPPEDLVPEGARSYGEIVKALKRQGQSVQEYAEYRVATDGAFVHRTIEAGAQSFFFRKVEHDDFDPCYAIRYTLPS